MPEYWTKLKVWVAGLPWYFKWIGFIVLGLALGAIAVSLLFKTTPDESLGGLDNLHRDETDNDLAVLGKEEKRLKEEIGKRKREIAKALNQGHNIDNQTMIAREKITKARTMEELDALQKELGL